MEDLFDNLKSMLMVLFMVAFAYGIKLGISNEASASVNTFMHISDTLDAKCGEYADIYLVDRSNPKVDSFIKKDNTVYSFKLPKGISPFGEPCEQNDRSVIVKDDATHKIGVYSTYGYPVIPCEWDNIETFVSGDDELGLYDVNLYQCWHIDGSGAIFTHNNEVGDSSLYNTIALTKGKYVARFGNQETDDILRRDNRQWYLNTQSTQMARFIVFTEATHGQSVILGNEGEILADSICNVSWVDSQFLPRVISFLSSSTRSNEYYNLETRNIINSLHGSRYYGEIRPGLYIFVRDGNTMIYDVSDDQVVWTVKGYPPMDDAYFDQFLLAYSE